MRHIGTEWKQVRQSSSHCWQQGASAQSAEERVKWTQSIERLSRDWDCDGERILGHIGYDIGLWDATTGVLLHRQDITPFGTTPGVTHVKRRGIRTLIRESPL